MTFEAPQTCGEDGGGSIVVALMFAARMQWGPGWLAGRLRIGANLELSEVIGREVPQNPLTMLLGKSLSIKHSTN